MNHIIYITQNQFDAMIRSKIKNRVIHSSDNEIWSVTWSSDLHIIAHSTVDVLFDYLEYPVKTY